MTINLSSYSAIEAGIFVKIQGEAFTWLFSDYIRTVTIDGSSYTGLGKLLAITSSSSEIKVTNYDLTIAISGVPNTSISDVLNNPVKGSKVTVYRALFNPSTGALLSISGNPMSRYIGVVNNYGITEEYDSQTRNSKNTVSFTCSSFLDILGNTASGRRTNSDDEKYYYQNDLSMDRVKTLVGSNFNFGAPG